MEHFTVNSRVLTLTLGGALSLDPNFLVYKMKGLGQVTSKILPALKFIDSLIHCGHLINNKHTSREPQEGIALDTSDNRHLLSVHPEWLQRGTNQIPKAN